MENIRIPIFLTTSVLVFYTLSPFLGVPYALISTLFLIINGMLIWMVLRILKDGVPSGQTFEETWYDDYHVNINRERVSEPPHTLK